MSRYTRKLLSKATMSDLEEIKRKILSSRKIKEEDLSIYVKLENEGAKLYVELLDSEGNKHIRKADNSKEMNIYVEGLLDGIGVK